MNAPIGFHVHQKDGKDVGGGALPSDTWLRYRALYSTGYDWRAATDQEIAAYNAEKQRLENL